MLRAIGDRGEQRGVGAGQPSLTAECVEYIIERGAALLVQMRRDLVKQQKGGIAPIP